MNSAPSVVYAEGFRPGYIGRIAQMHGEYYAVEWGSGLEFEALMAREIVDFYEDYRPERDLLLTAHCGNVLVGCIAVEGAQTERAGARLRWYLLMPEYHGQGIGKALLTRALDFCRDRRFEKVYLWTVEGLPLSRALYEKAGFEIVERIEDDRYTVPHVNLRMELPLGRQ